jgi:cell division protein FtsW
MKTLSKILVLIVLAMMAYGAIMVFTASGTYSATKFNNIYTLFKSHLWKVFAAIFFMIVASKIPYEYYRKYSKPMMIGIIIVLIATLIFAPKVKGASRWIDFGFFQFQPSEAAKVFLLIHLAVMMEKMGDKITDFKQGLLFPLIWVGAIAFLIVLQPNISTSAIVVLISFTILYIGGARFKHLFFIVGGAFAAGGSAAMLFTHSRERILTFIKSLVDGSDINMQVKQAKIALGSGGWFGVGMGHSRQSDLFLPESYGDFIFSILGEEAGVIGAIVVLFIYLIVFALCLLIAKRVTNKFGQLLVIGLGFNIIISAFINAGVVTGMLPTTGITLPFISFGGTSIILFGISIGIILNVANQTIKTEDLRVAQAS